MRFHFNIGPFGVSTGGRMPSLREQAQTAKQDYQDIRQGLRDIKPMRFRGNESKKNRVERRKRAREIARSAKEARRTGVIT